MPIYRLFDRTRFPLLTSLVGNADLKFVDIGGRGSAFPPLIPLAPFAHYYAAEPDAEEAQRLREELPRRAAWRGVTVMSEAIAARRGEASLHVTREPGMSSLLPPDRSVTGRYYLGSKFEVVAVVTVPTLPLDEAASRYGFSDAAFLKLDTQGTELDILQSGQRLLDDALLGVHVEANFRAFYKGQAVFADVDSYLRRHGFELFSLSRTLLRRSGYRESVYSARGVAWAHCLYLREPDVLLHIDADRARRQVAGLLSIALAFEFYDVAFEIVELAQRTSMLGPSDLTRLREEVGSFARVATRHIVRRAQEQGGVEALMAASFRDRKHRE